MPIVDVGGKGGRRVGEEAGRGKIFENKLIENKDQTNKKKKGNGRKSEGGKVEPSDLSNKICEQLEVGENQDR